MALHMQASIDALWDMAETALATLAIEMLEETILE
jgi:hypothetical protein